MNDKGNDKGNDNDNNNTELKVTINAKGFEGSPWPIAAFEVQDGFDPNDPVWREQVLRDNLLDPTGEGQAILGQELLYPTAALMDYMGLARKCLRVRPLVQGELFRVAKDVRTVACVVGQDGASVESRLYGQYVMPCEFKVCSFLGLPNKEEIDNGSIVSLLEEIQEKGLHELLYTEDSMLVKLLDFAAGIVNPIVTSSGYHLAAFQDTRMQVEQHRLVGARMIVPRDEVQNWKDGLGTKSMFDECSQPELIKAGYHGSVLGCSIVSIAEGMQEVVPAKTAYMIADPEYLGELGIRVALFSESYSEYGESSYADIMAEESARLVAAAISRGEDPSSSIPLEAISAAAQARATRQGLAWMEIIGMCIPNPRAVAKVTIV